MLQVIVASIFITGFRKELQDFRVQKRSPTLPTVSIDLLLGLLIIGARVLIFSSKAILLFFANDCQERGTREREREWEVGW